MSDLEDAINRAIIMPPIDATPTTSDMLTDLQNAMEMLTISGSGMNSAERVQTRTECTIADLEAWGDSVEIRDEVSHDPFRIARVDRSFPPCIGCGGPVFSEPDGALVVNTTEKTVTFRPCGHVLAVPDMPNGWLNT